MKNVIFIAPPSAGKGTQSSLLMDNFHYEHISTGDMLRSEIASGSSLGDKLKKIMDEGKLVDDELIIELIKNKLSSIKGPYILDGFPRTLNQAQALDEIIDDNYEVIYLNISKEEAIKRVIGRLTCKCGKSYNLNEDTLKPKKSGICDSCGSVLQKRDDDNEESFVIRYETFLSSTKPLIEYYKNKNKLHTVDMSKDRLEVFEDIKGIVIND